MQEGGNLRIHINVCYIKIFSHFNIDKEYKGFEHNTICTPFYDITFFSIRSFIPEPHIISMSLMIIIIYHKFQNSHRAL